MMLTARIAAVVATLGLALGLTMACGSDDDNKDEDTSTEDDLSFTDDVNPILIKSCGASTCHGTASPGSTVYVGNEANFKAATTMKSQLSNNIMPESKASACPTCTLSADDEATLVKFYDQ